eukprot:TRINITY_DN49780_c0_g1_i1.p1 TRINITY_DN49780_c0_g1~~TRINITY_DN49780_c0_g1_i1.p1  ORF type:complete len:167 (-),score=24.42 TRINITY_DN49780_c0_g1_i1:64-564(-)
MSDLNSMLWVRLHIIKGLSMWSLSPGAYGLLDRIFVPISLTAPVLMMQGTTLFIALGCAVAHAVLHYLTDFNKRALVSEKKVKVGSHALGDIMYTISFGWLAFFFSEEDGMHKEGHLYCSVVFWASAMSWPFTIGWWLQAYIGNCCDCDECAERTTKHRREASSKI